MSKYIYDGPVMSFGKLITSNWHGETAAESEARARSNLTYQLKKQMHVNPATKFELPGKMKVVS